MNIENAVSIVKKQGLKPISAYESNRYFVFFVTDRNGNAIGNGSAFVVDKRTNSGKWIPKNAFPLDDDGEMKEYIL